MIGDAHNKLAQIKEELRESYPHFSDEQLTKHAKLRWNNRAKQHHSARVLADRLRKKK